MQLLAQSNDTISSVPGLSWLKRLVNGDRERERDIHVTVCVCAVVFLCRIVLFRHFDGKTLIFSKRRLCMVIDPKVADCPEEKLQENCDIL